MERDIRINWFYPYPVDTIWACLTEPALLRQWSISSGDFRAEVGFKWQESRKPKPRLNWDGKMYFEVLEVVPLQKLVYAFRGGSPKGGYSLDTVVTWTLVPKNEGTELQLVQSGFKGARAVFSSFLMELGWKNGIAKKFSRTLQQMPHEQSR
ncbi:SRPBCC family protein [Chitinophaga vietnamensis]|uniref:SRPBCC family protein n=1 Tax=Chitinophaga vietnamensis TaxID=2593957 RepID=UPI0011786E1F|nr:SRPBCC domain-containing protein [Chitinophaga vietnamensis]